MTEKSFEGVYPVLSLPFTDKKEIDYDSLGNLVDFCYKKGALGIVMFGVASEFYKISDEESKEVIKAVVAKNKKRMNFIVGVGKLSTDTTIAFAKFCNNTVVDGLMIFPPYFIPLSAKSLFEHYLKVAKSVNLPIIIQDAPQVSGANMDMDFYINLSKNASNIKYAKIEAPFSGPKIQSLISAANEKIKIFDGWGGSNFYEHLVRGCCGLMPGCAVVEKFVEIYNKFKEDEKEEAYKLHKEVLPLINFENQGEGELYIACEKLMLKHRGVISSPVLREPSMTLDKTSEKLLMEYLGRLI